MDTTLFVVVSVPITGPEKEFHVAQERMAFLLCEGYRIQNVQPVTIQKDIYYHIEIGHVEEDFSVSMVYTLVKNILY